MKSGKQWKSWSEFLKFVSADRSNGKKFEQEALRSFKHQSINMTRYYISSLSGWNDFQSKRDK